MTQWHLLLKIIGILATPVTILAAVGAHWNGAFLVLEFEDLIIRIDSVLLQLLVLLVGLACGANGVEGAVV